jgi:hypothetical protein
MISPGFIRLVMPLMPSRSWTLLVAVSSLIGVLMALAVPVHVR